MLYRKTVGWINAGHFAAMFTRIVNCCRRAKANSNLSGSWPRAIQGITELRWLVLLFSFVSSCWQKGTSNIVLAASKRNAVKSLKDTGFAHEMRYTQLLSDTQTNDVPSSDSSLNAKTMDIRANGVLIPSQVTTYWCAIVELSDELKRQKHHAIKVV